MVIRLKLLLQFKFLVQLVLKKRKHFNKFNSSDYNSSGGTKTEITLGKADGFALKSVKMAADFSTNATSSDQDITDRFTFDNGQRDAFYDLARIVLKPGSPAPTGRLLVTFDFFTHSGGDYFSVDSYDGVVDYEDIPQYSSLTEMVLLLTCVIA